MGRGNNGLINFQFGYAGLAFILLALLMTSTINVSYADDPSTDGALQLLTNAISARFSNFSALFSEDILKELGFCIQNV